MNQDRLIHVMQQLADHTKPECAGCRLPFRCCSPEYCEITQEYAREVWQIELSPKTTNHPKLPFMSAVGCVVPPHLRPLCTFHTCEINSIGIKVSDASWTSQYFQLREEAEELYEQLHSRT